MSVYIEGEFKTPTNIGETHLPCAILVDTSSSMSGGAIQELNEGIKTFIETLREDSQAMGRVEVCVIAFASDVTVSVPYTPADEFDPPHFEASGCTAMNQAIMTALDMLEDRKNTYRQNGVKWYRPWLFLMTDGGATDPEVKTSVLQRLSEYSEKKKVNFFPMGIGEYADYAGLKDYANGGVVLKADASSFKNSFVWLSHSLSVVSNSNPGDRVQTPALPTGIDVLA